MSVARNGCPSPTASLIGVCDELVAAVLTVGYRRSNPVTQPIISRPNEPDLQRTHDPCENISKEVFGDSLLIFIYFKSSL